MLRKSCNCFSRKVKPKQHQVSCKTCQVRFHKIFTYLNDLQYSNVIKHNVSIMCFRCQSNKFPFLKQLNSDLFILNSGFHNFDFSRETVVFPDKVSKNLSHWMQLYRDSLKRLWSSGSNRLYILLKIIENFSLLTLHPNIAFLSKYSKNLLNFLS